MPRYKITGSFTGGFTVFVTADSEEQAMERLDPLDGEVSIDSEPDIDEIRKVDG